MEHENEYSYNLMGLSVLISIKNASENAIFVVSLWSHVLYQSNLKFWNVPPYMVRPYDFGTDDRFELYTKDVYMIMRLSIEIT